MALSKYVFIVLFILQISIILAQHGHHDHHEEHSNERFEMITTEDHHDPHDYHEESILSVIGITTFAGFASFIGAFSIFCIKKEQICVMPASLAFSAGVTIYLSFVNLIPESMEQFHHSLSEKHQPLADVFVLLCIIGGICVTLTMETLFQYFGIDPHHHSDHSQPSQPTRTETSVIENDTPKLEAIKSLSDNDNENQQKHTHQLPLPLSLGQTKLVKSESIKPTNYSYISYKVAFALILHHFPEGIATFVSLYHDLTFGVLVAFALALHDIPSGICISVPTYLATGSKIKPFVLCFIAAVVYPIGAVIGWIIIEISDETVIDIFVASLFGITAGIMLYISFVELLPTAIIAAKQSTNENKHKHVYNITIGLLFAGFLVMAISNILLNVAGGHSH